MIPTRVTNLEKARKQYGKRADFYASFLTVGDELADNVVLAFEKIGPRKGHEMLNQALDQGIQSVKNAPEALLKLFEQIDDIPEWVDWKRVNHGARVYQRTGIAGSLVLSALSLMNGYHSHAATKPLVFTGQLDTMARRRLAETGRFIAETAQVDGLRRFRPGFKTTIKVRLIHAQVRRFLSQSDRWDTAAWGLPINNADMAATTLTFSVAMMYGTRYMGLRFKPDEADDVMQLWKYSGYLSGVDAALLCESEPEAMTWSLMIDMLQPGPDEGSIRLAEALRKVNYSRGENAIQRAMVPLMAAFHDGLTWATAGDEVARDLKTPHEMWKHAIPLTKMLVTPIELARERLPLASYFASLAGNYMLRTAVKTELQGKSAEFHPPAKIPHEHRFQPVNKAAS